jgi:hypothetical protein
VKKTNAQVALALKRLRSALQAVRIDLFAVVAVAAAGRRLIAVGKEMLQEDSPIFAPADADPAQQVSMGCAMQRREVCVPMCLRIDGVVLQQVLRQHGFDVAAAALWRCFIDDGARGATCR